MGVEAVGGGGGRIEAVEAMGQPGVYAAMTRCTLRYTTLLRMRRVIAVCA
jgi:hypothetical protein